MKKITDITINILILGVAFVLAVGLGEMIVRWQMPEAKTHGLKSVNREKMISFNPGARDEYKSEEYQVTFEINSYGRRDKEWDMKMLQEPSNILFVGDSMVLGYGLKIEDTIPVKMENLLFGRGKTVKVFNFGMGGAISVPEYKLLLEDALQAGIKAETVLVGIFIGNDFTPSTNVVPPSSLDKHSALYRFLKRQLASSPKFIQMLFRFGKAAGVDVYQSPESYIFLRHMTEAQQTAFDSVLYKLPEIQKICETNHRKFRVIIFPSKLQVENAAELENDRYLADGPNRRIIKYCEDHKIPYLDLLPWLRQGYEQSNHQPVFFPVDRHLNPRGAALTASLIVRWLSQAPENQP